MRLEQVSQFKHLGCVLNESGTADAERRRNVASGRTAAGAIRSLFNARICSLSARGCYRRD